LHKDVTGTVDAGMLQLRFTVIKYDLQKYSFTERIGLFNLWNCLPMCVVESPSVDSFKRNLDKFWCSQDIYYNYKSTITGTGNRSIVM